MNGLGIELLFRFDQLSQLILFFIIFFGVLLLLYSLSFMQGKPHQRQFYLYYFLTLIFAAGAVAANNLLLMLFFWEAMLLTLFGLIFIGGERSYRTALKALIIAGVADLCLMFGIILTAKLAGTLTFSAIHLSAAGAGGIAFLFLLLGALGKSGCMPFHSWIPDAATDAPLPFMALYPGALEKLIGIYFLARITLETFKLEQASWLSFLLMSVGGITIILAVMMALIQKDYKKLLSYHAISQVGYMVLGIGTLVPAGIVGGLFHMINNALYKSCLFLTGGAVEKQTGTSDLNQISGLAKTMPITFACFLVAALSISGVPGFNGFFSKELIYEAALERGWIFYLLAAAGSFFTAASFLKLGHAAYFGQSDKKAKEASWIMLPPMIILAVICLVFGLFNVLPIRDIIQPIVKAEHDLSGWPANPYLTLVTVLVLLGAVLNHWLGVKKAGRALGAADHIHHAPVLSQLYDRAEKKYFDPYEWGMKVAEGLAKFLHGVDRMVDAFFEVVLVRITAGLSYWTKEAHNGNFALYMIWSLIGAAIVMIALLRF
jgi:formate hydrogenlyase subunit 3/multisubunit Na+/H+ antiporter MnhD subunit